MTEHRTVVELRAQIPGLKQELQRTESDKRQVLEETGDAVTRQMLRREMDKISENIKDEKNLIEQQRRYRNNVDRDESGPYMPIDGQDVHRLRSSTQQPIMDCSRAVVPGRLEWSIKGFSWLRETLAQNGEEFADSPSIEVAGHIFSLVYHSDCGEMGRHCQKASLAIWHDEPDLYYGATFRYTIWIKSRDRGYVQWGAGSICMNGEETDCMIFGPDVCDLHVNPQGIFGKSHAELLQSEWVIEDSFSVKLHIEVRPKLHYNLVLGTPEHVVVPPPDFSDNMLSLLDSTEGVDVSFVLQGETIKAHSQILSARSEVLRRQFACGLQESISKEVVIDDIEPWIFKAFLRYLYSDSFASLQDLIDDKVAVASGSPCPPKSQTTSILQQLLATSHKYQSSRLQLWCEHKLCECIGIDNVCSVLCQAYLHEAKELEKRCLDVIAANMDEVAKSDAFGTLSRDWPQVSLKITLHLARVPESIAKAAIEHSMRKRKRAE